jgi:hypothetical protein
MFENALPPAPTVTLKTGAFVLLAALGLASLLWLFLRSEQPAFDRARTVTLFQPYIDRWLADLPGLRKHESGLLPRKSSARPRLLVVDLKTRRVSRIQFELPPAQAARTPASVDVIVFVNESVYEVPYAPYGSESQIPSTYLRRRDCDVYTASRSITGTTQQTGLLPSFTNDPKARSTDACKDAAFFYAEPW